MNSKPAIPASPAPAVATQQPAQCASTTAPPAMHTQHTSGISLFGTQEFEDKTSVRKLLEERIPAESLSVRPGADKFTYVESWKAIEIANAIFGFEGWSSSVVDMDEMPGPRFRVGVTAVVKVSLKNGSYHEDVGFGMCENKCKGTAIENAKKEAVSDARKRALRVFGNALGNSVYDRDYIQTVHVPQKGSDTVTFAGLRKKSENAQSPTSLPVSPYSTSASPPKYPASPTGPLLQNVTKTSPLSSTPSSSPNAPNLTKVPTSCVPTSTMPQVPTPQPFPQSLHIPQTLQIPQAHPTLQAIPTSVSVPKSVPAPALAQRAFVPHTSPSSPASKTTPSPNGGNTSPISKLFPHSSPNTSSPTVSQTPYMQVPPPYSSAGNNSTPVSPAPQQIPGLPLVPNTIMDEFPLDFSEDDSNALFPGADGKLHRASSLNGAPTNMASPVPPSVSQSPTAGDSRAPVPPPEKRPRTDSYCSSLIGH